MSGKVILKLSFVYLCLNAAQLFSDLNSFKIKVSIKVSMSNPTKVSLQLLAITPFLQKLMTILNICTSLLACWVVEWIPVSLQVEGRELLK